MATIDPRATLIESALHRHGLSYRWMADRLGTTHVTVSSWLRGESKPRQPDVWTRMLGYLTQYENAMRQGPGDLEVRRVGIRSIPVLPGLSAGGMGATHSDITMLEVKDWGNDRERWGRVVDGFSMSPELEPGDVVIFEARDWEPYNVVHAFDQGSDTVKVIRRTPIGVELVPVNPDYEIIDGKDINIKGVAMAWIRTGPNGEVTTKEYPHGLRIRIEGR